MHETDNCVRFGHGLVAFSGFIYISLITPILQRISVFHFLESIERDGNYSKKIKLTATTYRSLRLSNSVRTHCNPPDGKQ